MPTIGLFLSSPLHSSQSGLALGAGGENTATTLPRSSPLTSTMRTSPSACPVRSLKVFHSPTGVGDCALALNVARQIAIAIALALFTPLCARGEEAAKPGWSGTVGAGPVFFPKYTGGKAYQGLPIPIISANYQEVAYIELLRAGVYVLSSADKKLGLGFAAEPRLGFHQGDGARLAGMTTRRHSLEGGLAFDWENPLFSLDVSYFIDLTRATHGRSLRASLSREFVKREQWTANAFVGVDRIDAKIADYYFGVHAGEGTPQRPIYQPGAGANLLWGADAKYQLDPRHALVFGIMTTRLNSSAAQSPIVETRIANMLWLGYAWNL